MTGHKLAGIRFVLEDGKCVLVSMATVVWGRQYPSPHTPPVVLPGHNTGNEVSVVYAI